MLFYQTRKGTLWVYVFYFVQMVAGFVLISLKGGFFAELFPTPQRSSFQSILVSVEILSGTLSTFLVSFFYTDSNYHLVTVFTLPAFLVAPLIFCCLPETAGVDLEILSPTIHDDDDDKRVSPTDDEALDELAPEVELVQA